MCLISNKIRYRWLGLYAKAERAERRMLRAPADTTEERTIPMRKFLALLLALVCLCCTCQGAFADARTYRDVRISLSADKAAYAKGEDITVTLTAENRSDEYILDVLLEAHLLPGYVWKSGQGSLRLGSMYAGQKQEMTATMTPYVAPPTGDGAGIGPWLALMGMAGAAWLAVVSRRRAAKRALAMLLCAAMTASLCPAAVAESIADWPVKKAKQTRSQQRASRERYSAEVTQGAALDGAAVQLCATVSFSLMGTGDNLTDDEIDFGDLMKLEQEGLIDVIVDEKGKLVAIDGTFTDEKVSSEAEAAAVLNSAWSLFGEHFNAHADEITENVLRVEGSAGDTYYRYLPENGGLPVLGSQIILSVDASDTVLGLMSTYDERVETVSTTATITQAEAVASAKARLLLGDAAKAYVSEAVSGGASEETAKAALLSTLETSVSKAIYAINDNKTIAMVYAVRLSTDFGREANPAYDALPAAPLLDETIYVCANGQKAGNVISQQSNIAAAWEGATFTGKGLNDHSFTLSIQKNDDKYRMHDPVRNIDVYETQVTGTGTNRIAFMTGNLPVVSKTDFFGNEKFDEDVVSLMGNMRRTYAYYLQMFGRDSYDGEGSLIRTFNNFYSDEVVEDTEPTYNNAAWYPDEDCFVFGDGNLECAAALDVVGHEFTHAVGDYQNDLFLERSVSGALDEAYADIMGSFIESKSRTADERWMIGEDIPDVRTIYGAEALRRIDDPSSIYGHFEHYDQYDDDAGFYKNSTIFSHAAYRMITDRSLSDISDQTWAKVFYASMPLIASDGTFLQARAAVVHSARLLGFTSEQQTRIKAAFDAVGICEPETLRFVLEWGSTPRDLDSHLVGPGVGGNRFHVYFGNMLYNEAGEYDSVREDLIAELDYDDVTSFGPEVTTLYLDRAAEGTYYFYVHDYTNGRSAESTEMGRSGARVKVYWGERTTPIGEYYIDYGAAGTIWNVCKIRISDKRPSLEWINTYDSDVTYR